MFYVYPLLARALNRLRLLQTFRIGYKRKILDKSFKIPIIENKEGLFYNLKVGEPFLLEVFRNLFKAKNFTFLDAGVNFGQTLLKVKAVNLDTPYIGFEPSGLCSYYTSHLIKVNRFPHAKLIRCALSNNTGVLTLYGETEGDTRASILKDFMQFGENAFEELVPVVTLDSLIPIITTKGKDIILKIDVEGAEWLVFQGATKFIDGYRPLVIFENLPFKSDTANQFQQKEISDFFNERDYEIYLIDEVDKILTKIAVINNEKDYQKTNYMAVPAEQRNLFEILT